MGPWERSVRKLRLATVAVGLVIAGTVVADEEVSAGAGKLTVPEAIRVLRQGGYVIYMRHALTDTSVHDYFPQVDLQDCQTQRNLTAAGRSQALAIGKAIKRQRIPIGEVMASPYCRTRDTASLAFGGQVENSGLLNTSNLTGKGKAEIIAELRVVLGRPVPPGSNRVLVSHSSTLADTTGIFPRPEGVMVIFRPDGSGGFNHIATVIPTDWENLALPPR